MNEKDIRSQLSALFGGNFVTAEDALRERSSDLIGYRRWERFNGSYLADLPIGAVMAQSTEDVSKALKFANEHRIPVVPQCGRSCVCSGTETPAGSLVLDGSAMNEIISLDE